MVAQELSVPLAIPGDPDTLQSQSHRSHVSYPRKGLIPSAWTAQGSLLKLQFILCPQAVVLIFVFYNGY